ncbi:PKD domain-containing protein [Kitasatospora sp. McL0602]|uniref:PKD domain-containing protein n=1 Tax=Kitasatospora sp. McL0602 TaxID=3439530 RepID=UPI003F8A993D
MRHNRTAAIAALVVSVTTGLPLVGVAHADTLDLYVDKAAATCSDNAVAGSKATPFCTVSAAAAVAQAGQTVHIAPGFYAGDVHLTRSGTPGAPITFEGPDQRPNYLTPYADLSGVHGLTLDGVHDVAVRHLVTKGTEGAVVVTGSSKITLDDVSVAQDGGDKGTHPGVLITGASSDVTLSHSQLSYTTGDAVAVAQGVTGAVITTNLVNRAQGDGISVKGATGTVITGNTVNHSNGPAVEISGAASATTVENNVFAEQDADGGGGATPVGLAVAADSTAGTKADYNVVSTQQPSPYKWGSTLYANAEDFQKASGQGAHDLAAPAKTLLGNTEGSVLIDSADPSAPGEQDTDLLGLARVHDPLVKGTGTHDRGATEFQAPALHLRLAVTPQPDISHPLDALVEFTANSAWSTDTKVSVDFGDKSTVVTGAVSPLTHAFPKAGSYTVTATGTDSLGQTAKQTQVVTITGPAPVHPMLKVTQDSTDLRHVRADTTGTTSPWPVATTTFDYGDGTPATTQDTHTYAKSGQYMVLTTVTDTQGRQGSFGQVVTITDQFVPMRPTRVLDTRAGSGLPGSGAPVSGGQVLKLQVAGVAGLPEAGKVSAVLLNLTATRPTAGSFVTAFPSGSVRPTVSSLNFTAGQTVANAVVVPVGPDGKVSLYNFNGSVDLVADIAGYYGLQVPTVGAGNFIGSVTPTRVLDTRATHGPLGGGDTIKVKVRGGAGLLPDVARAVVLNLTATQPTQGGYVTAAPDGNPPSSSSLNFAANQTIANQVTVPIDADGTVTLYNHNGSVHLIADIQAFYSAPVSATGPLQTVTPTRLLDTRVNHSTLGAGGTVRVKVTGVAGVSEHATGVLVNLTATNPTAAGFLTAYAAGSPRPLTSILNFAPGQTVPNLAFVPVSSDGYIEVYNHSGNTDVLVDIQGYEN